jgi:biuret amidohydrolase
VVTNTGVDEIDAKKTALIVVHMSKGVVQAGIGSFSQFFAEPVKRAGLVEKVARVVDGLRAKGGVVVYTCISYRPGHPETPPVNPRIRRAKANSAMLAGSKEAEIADGLPVTPDDFVVLGTRGNGFLGSELDLILRNRRIERVAVCGVATNVAVESTARGASDLNYRLVMLSDGCVTNTEEAQQASLKTLGDWYSEATLTCDQFLAALK